LGDPTEMIEMNRNVHRDQIDGPPFC